MADQLAPAEDPFSQLDQDASAPGAAPPAPAKQPNGEPMNPALAATLRQDNKPDPFAELGEVGPGDSTTKGAFGRAAARGTLPAAAGLAAMGAGAELGAAAGSVVPGWGTVVGGVGGALAGGLVGGYLGSAAQDWALSKLPDSFVDALGQGERQRRLDEAQHPTATFVGGMTPYAVTMRPGAAALTKLPENATAVQRLVANKATAVLFGGAVNGGMELGQEAVHGDINWQHVAIATGFGMVFNQPTKLGQVITEAGAHPARAALGIPHPTIAQAGDLKVMGPGVTEEVFQGGHEQAPSAAMTAQDAARTEHATIGELPEPDLHEIANRMEPELFARMQTLEGQRDTFKRWMDEGGASDAASRHLAAVEAEIGELQPQVAAAYRRAADTTGTGIVEPEQFPSFAAMLAAHERGTGGSNVVRETVPSVSEAPSMEQPQQVPAVPSAGQQERTAGQGQNAADSVPGPQRTIGEQRAFIANDVAEKLIAAGRTEEEARASGQLAAARYVTRAGRFEGKLGTPEELYAREGAAIAGPEGRARPPAEVIREATTAGAQHNEAAQAAHTAAQETAAKPTEPGLISQDFDTSDRIKNEWRKTTPFKETEPFIQASWHNQRALGGVADQIAAAVGVEFKNPGIKSLAADDIAGIKDENKRKLAEMSRRRLETKAKKHGIGGVTDQVRGGFDVQTPAQADQVIAELAKHYPVVDEGWRETPSGYFDRKAYVRFSDGMIGEIQVWPPGMFPVKDRAHGLYEGMRELPPWHPLIPQIEKSSREVYEPVRAALSPEWNAVLGSGGSEPNRLANSSLESIGASSPSMALTSDHLPSESTQASEGVQKHGSPSSDSSLTSDMFGVPANNVGPHTEPVNAAIYNIDHVNSLSPTEQKRELPKYTAAAEQAPKGVDQPAGAFMFDPTALNVDAQRFQFKSGGDEYGVTGALRNVTKWDPAKAQAIIVWEQADGKLFVADGHQRAGLARRLTEKSGAKGIELPGLLYREKDGISAGDIKAMAAVTNIANGSGSALDGAKVLRARPDLMDGSLPLSVGKGKQAAALARLGDEPFKMVVNDVIPEHYGAVVGELIPNDPARQEAAIKAIARFEPKNADEAAVLTQRVAQAELAKAEAGAQSSMFGDLETPESTAGEEMKIVGRAIADLKKDKGLFARVLANAERIEETGSQIHREAAQSIASDAEIFAKTLTSDAYSAGPIRTELIAAARDLKNGTATVGEASGRIINALRSQVEAHGLNRARDIGSAEPAKEFAQTDQFDFEAGAEGKPQSLIPGVAPVSQRDLIQAAANKPLAPKKAQKEIGGLFGDSMDQKELFQREQVQTPEFKQWFGDSKVVDAEGNPQVVYHGTAKKFSSFSKETTPGGVTWFTSDRAAIDRGEVGASGRGHVMDLYASIKKPAGWAEYDKWGLDELASRGYDGVILPNKDGSFDGFVFEPEQLKSASANSGQFDPSNANIYKQTARGKIRISPNARPIITLMKDANASTFIHESGHQYLEEMMRDGDHPDAPIALRDDAQTIRDWLGVDGSDEIKTRHHEKFARGFEQYVREGVAPSPELAGVFAKFRNWLLSIYQSIKGLGTEISPEIRGVFDRMLEMEPQRTVIAPERQSPTLLHDIHEAEAATVEPHEAEAAMDRVVAESNRYIEEQPPEIQREIETARVKVQEAEAAAAGADPAAGGPAGDGAERAGAVGEGGGGPDAQPAGGAGSAEHGAVKPGGGDAGAESAKPIVDRRAGLGNDAATALAPGPADLFGARESPFTDRAGNIRIENLTKHEDVAQAIRDAAQENNDFIGDRRGVITDGQVAELADALGMDARQLNQRHVGQAFNAEQIVAARKLLIQSATDVAAMMKKAATGTDEDVMAYAAAKDRHQMIQAQVSGITAEAGRALRAFRSLAGQEATKGVDQFIREATGKTLFQLRQEAQLGMALDTPQQVSKFMMDAQKRSFGRMILEYWINSILSGPATHATNIIGNSILAVQHFGPESAIAAIVGKAQSALGREGTRVRLGEVKAALGGYRRGLAPALSATGEAARKGASTLLPGEVPSVLDVQPHDALAARGTLNPETTYADVVRDTFGAMRGLRDAVLSVGVLAKGGIEGSPLVSPQYSHLGAIPDIQVRGVTVLPVGTVIRTPGRFLAVADTFFKAANYSASVSKQAYRVASDEGLTGTRFDARVAELRSNPTDAMMQEARGDATSTTLMNKGGQFVQAMNHLTSAVVHLPLIGEITPLKFVNPFVNIAGQIINQSIIQRSPVGLLSRELRADLSGQNGNIAQDMAMARMLMGTAVAITMGGLAAEGYASGSGPKDHDAATMWKLAGNQAHSVLIGGVWYGVNKLGPVGMLMGMAADLYDVAHKAGEGEYAKAAAYFHHALVQNILDQSWMKGPADIIQAVEDPDRYGQRWVQNYVSSFVPNALAQAARRQDPYSREAKTVIDAIKSKIPGLSETLPPRRDIWGEPIPNQEAVGGKAVTGIYVKKMSEDPVNKAMVELDMHPGAVEKKIRNVELTPQQHDDYARIAGRLLKMNMDKIVASDMWQEIPYAQKQTLIQHTIEANRNVARNMVIMKHPQIASDAVTEKLRAIREGKKKK